MQKPLNSYISTKNHNNNVYIRGHFTAFLSDQLATPPLELQAGVQCHVDDYIFSIFSDKRVGAAAFDIEGDAEFLWDAPGHHLDMVKDDDFPFVGVANADLEQAMFDWIQKTLKTPVTKFAEKIKFKKDITADSWIDEKAKAFASLMMDEINKYIDVELVNMLRDKVRCCDARVYNICIAKKKVRQLFEVAPILASLWVEKNVPTTETDINYYELPETVLDQTLAQQILQLWGDTPLVGSELSVKEFVTKVKRSALPFDTQEEKLKEYLRNSATIDYNFIRRIETDEEMLVLAAANAKSGGLANILVRDPNFAQVILDKNEDKGWSGVDRTVGQIYDFYSEVIRENNRVAEVMEALPEHIPNKDVMATYSAERMWEEQEIWHRMYQRQYRAGDGFRQLSDKCDEPFPKPPLHKMEVRNDEYKLVFLEDERKLAEESAEMSHCVHSYHSYVRKGESWIFGLLVRHDLKEYREYKAKKALKNMDKPKEAENSLDDHAPKEIKWVRAVTVQFDVTCEKILQARRKCNESPSAEENQQMMILMQKMHQPLTQEEKERADKIAELAKQKAESDTLAEKQKAKREKAKSSKEKEPVLN